MRSKVRDFDGMFTYYICRELRIDIVSCVTTLKIVSLLLTVGAREDATMENNGDSNV